MTERFPVSVVIPVRNEARTIETLLGSLLDQTRQADETIIVDGGSTDGTVEAVERLRAAGYPIKLARTAHSYPGEGRNIGVMAASHEVIAFTDGGIRLDARWLEKLCEALERDSSLDVVYGTYEPIVDTFFKECAALAYVPAPVERNGCRIRGPSLVSSLVKKTVWRAVGGFRPYRAAEDLIFMGAVEQTGFSVGYAPDAVAHWQIAPGWKTTFRRFAVYSRHNLIAGQAHHWHFGLARMYGPAFLFLVLGVMHSGWWLLIPIGGFLARVVITAYRKRDAFPFRDTFRPKRLVYLGALLLLLDTATARGAFEWLWKDSSKRRHERSGR